jgi:hypothetical protein
MKVRVLVVPNRRVRRICDLPKRLVIPASSARLRKDEVSGRATSQQRRGAKH